MNDAPSITDLVTRAANGDEQAWNALVERHAPLIWSICRRYRLSNADCREVSQNVWLKLVGHLGNIREPAALPGWLATTTRRECGEVWHAAQIARHAPDMADIPDEKADSAEQVLLAERDAALREALTRLSASCQQLIALLIEDPPVPYAEISARLGIAVGSIGPCRGRCLDRLRRDPAIAALISTEAAPAVGELTGRAGPPVPRQGRPRAAARTHQAGRRKA